MLRRIAYIPILALLPLILEAQQAPFNYDANGNLLVNVAAGGGAGGTSSTFGAAFPGTGTAAGFKDGGGLMQPGLLDGSNFLEVDCKAGCSGAAGDTTASGTLAALNNTVVMAMAGVTSASFSLPAASTLVGTVVAEYSTDGGTSYPNSANLRTSSGQWVSSISVTNTGAAQGWNLQVPGGASHVRVRVSLFTSGTSGVNGALLRGVQQPEMVGATTGTAGAAVPNWLVMVGGSDGTNLRALSTDAAGKLNTLATQTGTWTVQPGNTANTTPWLISISQGGNTATVSAGGALKVDGSAVTQPISAASLPLPTGAATAAKQPALGTAGTPSADVITVQGVTSMTALKVDGSGVTQPVSAASLPLPAGASTAAKQPAIGTAGVPAADVITVQGVTSMTALKVDGSGVTQPVSGTVTANQGGTWTVQPGNTANTTPWLATIAQGGNSATVSAGGALKVDGSAATQPVSGTVSATESGTWTVNVKGNAGANFDGPTGAAVPANALQVGYTDGTNLRAPFLDPCQSGVKTFININQTANTKLLTGSASNRWYICSVQINAIGTATNIAFVEGTGTACATGTAAATGIGGGAGTAATGWQLAVNEGFVMGSGGWSLGRTETVADDFCLYQSAANQISGGLTAVKVTY